VDGSAKSVDLGASVNKDPFVQPASGAKPVEPTPPPSDPAAVPYDQAWKQAQQFLRQGQLDTAHKILSSWYGDPSLTPVQQEQLVDLLSQLAGTLIYSTEHHLEPAHVVREGETLEEIAARYQVTPQLLAKINGIADPSQLQPGRELKVVRGPFMAVVSVSRRELTLALDGRYAGRFPIGIGQEWEPVEGEFEVKSKFTNPTYYGRTETLDADDPNNPLGEHWLGLVSTDNSFTGPLGIHGTNDPATVQSESDPRGYIRLSPQDAEDVFDILTEGARVIIRR
jgi:lipoprotein-anchoring transpeptidase ErfK/SrfK